jgi:hypothetical protein
MTTSSEKKTTHAGGETVSILHNERRVVYEMGERTRKRYDNRRVRSLRSNRRERSDHFTAPKRRWAEKNH